MGRTYNGKAKLLYLAKILLEETDENHLLSTTEIQKKLEGYGFSVERKALYDDLAVLEDFGLDVQKVRERANKYFIASNNFELPELKLLVDTVQSSKFITEKKSAELIAKLEKLTSIHNARLLQRQVFVSGRVKTSNEQIYYNIDAIHEAISKNKKISFRYFEWTVDKKQELKHGGERYVQSPMGLALADNNYYLIAYSEKYEKIIHFRVDKMTGISVTEETAVMPKEKFDIAEYTNRTFNMFGGDEERVELLVHNSLIGVIIDRFGREVSTVKKDSEHFVAVLNISASPVFFGWLLSFGDKVKVISPKRVSDKVKKLVDNISKIY